MSFDNELINRRKLEAEVIASRPDLWSEDAAERHLSDGISEIEQYKHKDCPHCGKPLIWVAAGSPSMDACIVDVSEFECYTCNRSLTYNFEESKWTYSKIISTGDDIMEEENNEGP